MTLKFKVRFFFIFLVILTSVLSVYRTHRGSNDFDTYYHAGKAVLDHAPLYYTGEYHGDAGRHSPFLYAPIVACFLALFSLIPILPAAVLWNLFNFALFGLCVALILSLQQQPWQNLAERWKKSHWSVRLLSAAMGLSLLLDNLTMAQINIFIFSLCMASLFFWARGAKWISGLFLAAAILIKLTPALFLMFFLIRRQWKVLISCFAGLILFTLLIPTLIFGAETNRIYHRQWLGRTVKPMLIPYVPSWKAEAAHEKKKSPEEILNLQLANVLTVKNQSLQGAFTRLFLKDRNHFAYSTAFPILTARKFEKLPVLFPLERSQLYILIRAVQVTLVLILAFLTYRASPNSAAMICVLSLFFLSLPLFSPIARSHQFVSWSFAMIALFFVPSTRWRFSAWFGAGIYFLQALPYGKAAGLGAWANLILWISFAGIAFQNLQLTTRPKKSI